MNKILLLICLSLIAFGCTLDPPPKGKGCDGMKYVKVDEQTKCVDMKSCKGEDCGQYLDCASVNKDKIIFSEENLYAISRGLCPDGEMFECHEEGDESYCQYKNTSNSVFCEDEGYTNPLVSPKHCGATLGGNCSSDNPDSPNYKGKDCGAGYCQNGRCKMDSACGIGTHLDDGECIRDSSENCGESHTDCNAQDMFCSEGVCVAVCPDGSRECGRRDSVRGVCVDPMENSGYCGAQEDEVEGTCKDFVTCQQHQECVEGKCQCNPKYHRTSADGDELDCAVNTKNSCGSPDKNDAVDCESIEHVDKDTVDCVAGKCMIYNCEEGYHVYADENVCEQDSIDNCGVHGRACNVENADNSCGSNRVCSFSCLQGYHVDREDSTKCIEDGVTDCGGNHVNCTNLTGWKSGRCEDDACVIEECTTGYHLYQTSNICEPDDIHNCGEHGKACVVDHADNSCVDNNCTFKCHAQYFEKDGSCVSEGAILCGAEEVNCTTLSGWVSGTCEDGTCKATACTQNYYNDNGTCRPSDNNNCGGSGRACTTTGGTGQCQNNQCVFTCQSNYHLNASKNGCAQNTIENCGQDGYVCASHVDKWSGGKCTSDGKCQVETCQSGYHVYGTICEQDSLSHCGSHTNNCGTDSNGTWKCISGSCSLSCNSGYHLDNSKTSCLKDDINNCGSVGYKCADKVPGWSAGNCTNGKCVATACNTTVNSNSYHINGTTCEKNDDKNCGRHGNKCETVSGGAFHCNGTSCELSCNIDFQINDTGDGCEPEGPERCGPNHINCTNLMYWRDGTCTEGYCNASACSYGTVQIGDDDYGICSNGSCLFNGSSEGIQCPFDSTDGYSVCCEEAMNCSQLLHAYGNSDGKVPSDKIRSFNGGNTCRQYY